MIDERDDSLTAYQQALQERDAELVDLRANVDRLEAAMASQTRLRRLLRL